MAKVLAQDFGVKIHFLKRQHKYKGCLGEATDKEIWLYLGKESLDRIVSVLFHELGHIQCHRQRLYPAYHGYRGERQEARAVILHGLQAERYVDHLGEKMAKIYLSEDFKFKRCYRSKKSVSSFKRHDVKAAKKALGLE